MTTTIDQIDSLCVKFGWECVESNPMGHKTKWYVIIREAMCLDINGNDDDSGGIETFAMHAMSEAGKHGVTYSVDNKTVLVFADPRQCYVLKHDNTPLGISKAIIEALYRAL